MFSVAHLLRLQDAKSHAICSVPWANVKDLFEHANRQFKGPLAVRPVFLHSPERVEALVFLLMISLMVYFLVPQA